MKNSLKNVYFFGTSEIAVPVLAQLHSSHIPIRQVITQPPTHNKKGEKEFSPIFLLAQKESMSCQTPQTLDDKTFLDTFHNSPPDLCVLMAYGSIIPNELLLTPRYGWINIHPSLLPRWRGASPIQHAILHGDKTTGTTIILMDKGIDTGPILCQKEIPISSEDTNLTLSAKLSSLSADIICDCITTYINNEIPSRTQPKISPTPTTKRFKKSDGKIEWKKTSAEILRHIRALDPWPSSFTSLQGTQIKILSAADPHKPISLKPGALHSEHTHLYVGTGDSALEILSLQRAGKNPMGAKEFLRGFPSIDEALLI